MYIEHQLFVYSYFYRFQKHIDGSAELSSDLKSAVFSMAMANGDEATFDQLVKVSLLLSINILPPFLPPSPPPSLSLPTAA